MFLRTLASAHEIASKLREMKQRAADLEDSELLAAIHAEDRHCKEGTEFASKYDILWANVLRAEYRRRHAE